MGLLCDNDLGLRVVNHVPQQACRIGQFEDEVCASGAQCGKRGDDIVGAAAHEDADEVLAPDAILAQLIGESPGLAVEVGVGQGDILVLERNGIGRRLCLLDELRGEVLGRVENLGHRVRVVRVVGGNWRRGSALGAWIGAMAWRGGGALEGGTKLEEGATEEAVAAIGCRWLLSRSTHSFASGFKL